jgi:MFS transporter, SP family, sugar:H+ symporter
MTTTNHKVVGDESYKLGYVIFISCVAAIGGFLFGFDSAVINGTVNAISKAFGSSSVGTGFSVASMLLGCAVGAIYAGKWADKFGRKPVMAISAAMFLVSALGSGIATDATVFIIFRLIGGIAVGAASVIAPTYISEVAPAKIRGRLTSLQQMAIVLGICAAFFSNYLIGISAGSASNPFWGGFTAWKWMFWMEAIPAVAYLVLSFIIPESPRYLIANKKDAEAKAVLYKVWGHSGIDDEIEIIKGTVDTERKPKFTDIFVNGKLLPIVWIGVFIAVFQQLTGINVIMYYGSVLWEAAGFSESHALLINVLSGVVNVSSTIVAMVLIDKIGRKPLLIAGSIGMTITLGIVAVLFGMAGVNEAGKLALSNTEALIALVAVHCYIISFGASWGAVAWVMLAEIFNNKIRGAAMATSTACNWIANFGITMTFPIILGLTGLAGAYFLYAFFGFISIFFVIKFVKETKGMTLEEME